MKKTNNKGFSLVELIVVIAIMAVLMVVVGPQLLKNVDKARIQRDNQAIAEIANAAKIAMADEEVYKYVNGLSPKKVEVTFSSGAIVLDDNALENELAEVIGSDLELDSKRKDVNETEERYLMINSGGAHIKVILEDIVYAEIFNRKIVIHKLNDTIEYYGKMSDLESLAGDSFFRPHRAYLINFKYVEKYDASTVYLENGSVLMAKQNYPEFVKRYMKYIQRRG